MLIAGLAGAASVALAGCSPVPRRGPGSEVPAPLGARRGEQPRSFLRTPSTEHSPAAAAVLAYLAASRGVRTLVGVQENNANGSQNPTFSETQQLLMSQTDGLRPAIRGFDLRMSPGTEQTKDCIPVAKAAYEKYNQIPTFSYHMGIPYHEDGPDRSIDCYANAILKGFDINNLQVPGAPGYASFWQRIDELADRLAPLAEADVPILFRPFHETIASNFWWGSYYDPARQRWLNTGTDFVRLWRSVHQHLVGTRNLRNLLWVWCVESKYRMFHVNNSYYNRPKNFSYLEWYPGSEYVDVGGYDLYTAGWTNSEYDDPTTVSNSTIRYDLYRSDVDDLERVAASKPIALSECDWPGAGNALRSRLTNHSYQVLWHEGTWPSETAAGGRSAWYSHIQSVFRDDATTTAEKLPSF
jgi:mannan endo-1,4-beta-mannosidase